MRPAGLPPCAGSRPGRRVLMLVGGDLAVRGAERVVSSLGRTDSAVGLTVLALATTAELFALVFAALGTTCPRSRWPASSARRPTTRRPPSVRRRWSGRFAHGVVGPAAFALVLTAAVLLLGRRGSLGRVAGAALVAAYVAYVVLVLR